MRLFLLACLLVSGWGMAQSGGPTLAALSKEARARKARLPRPRVITNADLKNFQDAPVSISKTRPSDYEPREDEQKAPGAAEKVDAENQKMLDEAKQLLRAAAMDYKNAVYSRLVLQLRMNNLNNAFYGEQEESLRTAYEWQLTQTAQGIETNKEDILRTAQALAAAAQEARQAGFTDEEVDRIVGELPEPPSVEDLLSESDDSVWAETIQGMEPRQQPPPPRPPNGLSNPWGP